MARTVAAELIPAPPVLLPALFAPTPKASKRVLEFFTAQINNDNTRKAYMNATASASSRTFKPSTSQPSLQTEFTAPTVKQHLAALRMLFDWLVVGHVLDVNPAHAVRGPKYVVRKGKTPVLTAEEARALLDAIETDRLIGLRDRALIGVMVYTFARINAVLQTKVRDYFVQGRRGWVRLHEKGGKEHEVPCHHNLEQLLDEYIAAAGIAGDLEGPLFRTAAGKINALTGNSMWQQDAHRMIQRRAAKAGMKTRIGNHSFRATGITAYLKNGGRLEIAQQMANHESSRTTGLYDRRGDEITLDEVERVGI